MAVSLTLLLRLWFILELKDHPFSTMSPQYVDAWYYHQWAVEIAGGNLIGSGVFFLRPLYPYLLSLVYAVFGTRVLPVQLLQVAIAATSCLVLWDTARRMFNRTAAGIAALGFALCGVLVFYSGALLYVELTVFLALAFAWLLTCCREHWWRWPLTGFTYALLVICRPELLVLAPFCVAILWRTGTDRRHIGAFAITTALVLAVMPIHNLVVAGEPVLFTAHSGINFYYANNPTADGTWQPVGELGGAAGFSHRQLEVAARTIEGRTVSWAEASQHWIRQGLSYVVGEPLGFLRLLSRKFLLFWSDYEVPNNYYPETARAASSALRLAFVNYALVAALGVIGMVLAWPWRRRSWPAYLLVGGFMFSSLVFYVLSRLRAPVIPFLLIFGGFGVAELFRAVRSRRWLRLGGGLLLAILVAAGSMAVPVDRRTYSSQAWTQLGNIELARRRIVSALTALDRAVRENPNNPAARYSLLIALAQVGRVQEAAVHHSHLRTLAGQDNRARPLALLGAARMAIAERDFRAAARHYRSALELDPNDPETWYLLGLVNISLDSLVPAREYLARAAALDPHHTEARSTLERVESHLGRRLD